MELMLKPEIFTYQKLSENEFNKYRAALLPVIVPLEQSPAWGRFNQSIAGREFLGSFAYSDSSGKFIALASATLYSEKGRDWIWIKHGPLFAHVPNTHTIRSLCETLKAQFSQAGSSKPLYIRLNMSQKVQGLCLPFEHTMYDETILVELNKSEEDILAGMSKSGRAGLRKAQKTGVVVHEVTKDRADYFTKHCYPILRETGIRDGFGIHPLDLYTKMLEALSNESRLYIASYSSQVQAWAITTEYNTRAMYYYGGSSATARDIFAAYALHWEIMKEMKKRGNKSYDFMGIAGKNYEGLKNVTQFKIKFSKNVVQIPFTYDLPFNPLKYKLLSYALKLKRRLT